jgi:hypothetical protein
VTHEEYRVAARDVAWLAACAIRNETPDAARAAKLDLAALYQVADRHLLTGITAMALERAGVKDEAFTQARGKAIRKVAAFDVERAAVLDALEAAGIRYLPLKGCVLKELYPRIGMRQMSDNDILIDPVRAADAKPVMEGLGFVQEDSGSIHDHYFKPPVCNFELHKRLFGAGHAEALCSYYADIRDKLLPEPGRRFGFRLSDEDFYIYMIAHEYRHYAGGGAGLRSLLDTWVFLRQKGEALDLAYIAGELDKLGLADFETANRELALRLFGGEALTEADSGMLDYVIFSGAYGTEANLAKNRLSKNGRVGYLFTRAFLPLRDMRTLYPVLDRRPVLLPLCWALRLIRAVRTKPKKVLFQLRAAFWR